MIFPDSLLCQLPREKAYLQRQQQTRRSAHHSETVACLRLPLESPTARRNFGVTLFLSRQPEESCGTLMRDRIRCGLDRFSYADAAASLFS